MFGRARGIDEGFDVRNPRTRLLVHQRAGGQKLRFRVLEGFYRRGESEGSGIRKRPAEGYPMPPKESGWL